MYERSENFLVEQAKKQKRELERFVQDVLVKDTDYGLIPKTNKRCLQKSGAEKLCALYGYGTRFDIISREVLSDGGYFAYEIKSILFDSMTGQTVAEGVGACNSKEKKYLKSTPFDVANTVLKMAKKRAFVDAVLTATASSDIFTQDLTDEDSENKPADSQNNNNPPSGESGENEESIPLLSPKQLDFIYSLMSQRRITVEQIRKDLKKRYGINDCKELTREQASEYIKLLKEIPVKAS